MVEKRSATTKASMQKHIATLKHQTISNAEQRRRPNVNKMQTYDSSINQMFQHYSHLASISSSSSSGAPLVGGRRVTKVFFAKKPRGILNPTSISIVLISYIMFNQSIMMAIISSGRNLASLKEASTMIVDGGLANNGYTENGSGGSNVGFRNRILIESAAKGRSLVGLVAAEPAPVPAPASARSASSGSHRVPPLNGSIFGKRSVDQLAITEASNHQQQQQPSGHLHSHQQHYHKQQNQRQHGSPRLNSQQQQQMHPAPQQQYEPLDKSVANGESANNRYQQQLQAPKTRLEVDRTVATDYKDIITGIIEDFLALNNESNPDEASVAFCRMIVYECNQMLTTRNKALARRKRKRIQQAR